MIKTLTQSCMVEYLSCKKSLQVPIEEAKASTLKSLNDNYELAIRMNVAVMKNIASSQALQNEYKSYLSKVTSLEWLDSGIVFFFNVLTKR